MGQQFGESDSSLRPHSFWDFSSHFGLKTTLLFLADILILVVGIFLVFNFYRQGGFGSVYFKAKSPGLVKIDFLNSSMVLANDKRGSNVLKDLPSVSYLVLPEKISSDEKALQDKFATDIQVLGESTDVTQMKFYVENDVLGTNIDKEVLPTTKKSEFSLSGFLKNILQEYDDFVINSWNRVLGRKSSK